MEQQFANDDAKRSLHKRTWVPTSALCHVTTFGWFCWLASTMAHNNQIPRLKNTFWDETRLPYHLPLLGTSLSIGLLSNEIFLKIHSPRGQSFLFDQRTTIIHKQTRLPIMTPKIFGKTGCGTAIYQWRLVVSAEILREKGNFGFLLTNRAMGMAAELKTCYHAANSVPSTSNEQLKNNK